MTGAESLLCELMDCGSMDLKMLDDVNLSWVDILNEYGESGIPDFDSLMRAVVVVGLRNLQERIRQSVEDEEREFDRTMASDDEIEEHDDKIEALKELDPFEDIHSYHNCLDTHVWFEKHEELYKQYCEPLVEEFYDETGFEIEG